jgi:hypothetical protein
MASSTEPSGGVSMASGPARLFWVLCFVFGVGVIGLVGWFTGITPSQACSGQQTPWTPPFLAFQLAHTTNDIEAVFGRDGDPCRAGMVAALDLANKVDLIAFIGMYSGFPPASSSPSCGPGSLAWRALASWLPSPRASSMCWRRRSSYT